MSSWLLLGRWRRCSDALAQFHNPTGDLFIFAGNLNVALEFIERFLRLCKVQIVQYAQVQMRRSVIRFSGYRTLIGRFGFRKFAQFALDDAEFVSGHRVAGLELERGLEGSLGLGQA